MRFGNLTDTVARVLARTRLVVNPFGIFDSKGQPFTAEVLRANDETWTNFLASEQFNDPANRKRRKANIKAALSGAAAKGFRRPGKAKPEKVLDDLADDLVNTALDPVQTREKADRKKEGAGRILWIGGYGLDDENGAPLDLSEEGVRIDVLKYNTDPVTGKPLAVKTPFLLDEHGKQLLDEDGDPLENPYLNMPFGDAMLAWMEDESDDIEAYYVEEVQEVLGGSEPSPDGSPENGTDSLTIAEV